VYVIRNATYWAPMTEIDRKRKGGFWLYDLERQQRQFLHDAGEAALAAPALARSLRICRRNRGGIVFT
jgi:hypothetical protein